MKNLKTSDWVIWIPESFANDKSFYGPVYGLIKESTMSAQVFEILVDIPDDNIIGYIENNHSNCRDDFQETLRKKSLFFKDYHQIVPSKVPYVHGWYENDELLFNICLTGPIMIPTEFMGKIIDHPIFYPMQIKIYKTIDDIELDEEENNMDKTTEELRKELENGSFGSEIQNEKESIPDEAVVSDFLSKFNAEGETDLKAHDWKAYVPSSIADNPGFWGPVFGIIRKETESIYIFDSKKYENDKYLIGYIFNGSYTAQKTFDAFKYSLPLMNLIGGYENNALLLQLVGRQTVHDAIEELRSQLSGGQEALVNQDGYFDVRIKKYDTITNLFSRNTGLLESGAMLDKTAVLVGCGSVGSFVAMELARSGVGNFVLCDTDTLEIHNICRHQCGFDDLGRYKVDAVKDKILNINPNANVTTYRKVIQRVPENDLLEHLGRNTIIIGGGDNRGSADYACKLAIKTDSTFVSTGCWTRAFAGEIFYWASGHELSCYSCALGGLIDDDRPESHSSYFGTDEEKENLSFEPGIAADIDFVTIIAIKLALDLLNRDNQNYTPRVINYLKQYTWVCNTNSQKIGGERAGIFSHPLQITHSLKVNRNVECPFCGKIGS